MGYPDYVQHRYLVTDSERWHRCIILDGERYTPEACNLDDAQVIGVATELPDRAVKCKRCFKTPE